MMGADLILFGHMVTGVPCMHMDALDAYEASTCPLPGISFLLVPQLDLYARLHFTVVFHESLPQDGGSSELMK
jgi:hypothetical protein